MVPCSLVNVYWCSKEICWTHILWRWSQFRTSVNVYQTTWHHTPEDSGLHSHCHENFSLKKWCRGSAYLDTVMKVCPFITNGFPCHVLMCNHGRRKDLLGCGALLLPPVWKWTILELSGHNTHFFFLSLLLLLFWLSLSSIISILYRLTDHKSLVSSSAHNF
jgi:hypothetical protein